MPKAVVKTNSDKLYKKWTDEFAAAKKFSDKWQKTGAKVVKKFLDDRADRGEEGLGSSGITALNLFFSNIVTLKANLYGSMPKVEVDRTFADADDDIARVASLMATRMLQQDIQYSGEDFATSLRSALEDRLLPGLGTARVKYEFKSTMVDVPAQMDPSGQFVLAEATQKEQITDEKVPIIYTHWKDLLYSPARTYAEVWWKAYRSYMNRDELVERFKEELGKEIPLTSKGAVEERTEETEDMQAEVWEIWDRRTRKVIWFVEGFNKILDTQDDPLGLENFYPDPRPMVANTTTTKYIPRSDYAMAQDLYSEIDVLQSRISLLTEACKLVGVYDKNAGELKRIFTEGVENDLIPVDNWAVLGEKGGLKGVIDWVPIEEVAKVIEILGGQLSNRIQQLYEITGMSDILRGVSQPYEAAATSKAKVQFASIRIQALQDDFARFASDLQSLKMEIIQNHFQPYCIQEQSNIAMTPDAQNPQVIEQAIALLKDRKKARWRITIRPESLALADYAQLKADRTDYIQGISLFMQSAAPLLEMDKKATPVLLELLKWGLAGFKGSQEIEGVMDRAIKMYTDLAKQPEQPKPDPAMEKVKMEMQLSQQEHQQKMQQEQGRMANEQAEFQQKMQAEQQKINLEMQQDKQRFELELEQMRLKFQFEMKQLLADLSFKRQEANIKKEVSEHAAAVQMESADHAARVDRANGKSE